MAIGLNNLHPAKGSTHKKKRVGRGPGVHRPAVPVRRAAPHARLEPGADPPGLCGIRRLGESADRDAIPAFGCGPAAGHAIADEYARSARRRRSRKRADRRHDPAGYCSRHTSGARGWIRIRRLTSAGFGSARLRFHIRQRKPGRPRPGTDTAALSLRRAG